MTRRLFLGVALDDDTRHALAAHLDANLEDGFPGSPVPAQNWHITLRFLGGVAGAQRDRILAHLDQHIGVGPFSIRFGRLGAFPRPTKATVGWLATVAPELHTLAADCEDAARAAGLAPEDRPFHPHLTLSRIRPAGNLATLIEGFPRFPRKMRVWGLSLFESIPREGNDVQYREIDRVEL